MDGNGRSSITHSLPSTYYIPEETVHRYLPEYHGLTLLEKLQKLRENYAPDSEREREREQVTSQPHQRALSFVAKLLHQEDQSRAEISDCEEYLSLGKSLDMDQVMILSYKSEVVHHVNLLEKIFKKISLAQLPLTGTKLGRAAAEYELPPLLLKLRKFRGFAEIYEYGLSLREAGESIKELKAVRNLLFGVQHEQRYLCVSNGVEIFFLDIKQRKDQTFRFAEELPPLPKIGRLQLLEEGTPVASVGLFKWRSNAYMICGEVPKPLVDEVHSSNPSDECNFYGKCRYFSKKLYEGSSSRDVRRFSLAEDNRSISHSKSHFAKLNKPKSWPIIENISGQIHIFDSLPKGLIGLDFDWIFSHEVLDPDSGKCNEISSSVEDVLHIECHLVIEDYVFAISPMFRYSKSSTSSYLVLKSKTKEWEKCERKKRSSIIKDAWDILESGCVARCVGGFAYGQPNKLLYVIIALERLQDLNHEGTRAVAYLVTLEGKVVCFQVLHNFFTGPVWPLEMFDGKLVKGEGIDGKPTMCSIIIASTAGDDSECVFINHFSAEELTCVVSRVQQVLTDGWESWPVMQDFVHVDIMDKCIYKKNDEYQAKKAKIGEEDPNAWVDLQACFV